MKAILEKLKRTFLECPNDRARLATLMLVATGMKSEDLRLLKRAEAVHQIRLQRWPPPVEALFMGWLVRLLPESEEDVFILQGRNSQKGTKPVSRMTLWRILSEVGTRREGEMIRKFREFFRRLREVCAKLVAQAEALGDYELVPVYGLTLEAPVRSRSPAPKVWDRFKKKWR